MAPDEFREYVDAFLKAPKMLIGADQPLSWGPGRALEQKRLKLPLQIDGEIGEPAFVLDAYPDNNPATFHFLVVMEPAVCRYDHDPGAVHQNEMFGPARVLPIIVRGPHYHSWQDNRHLGISSTRPVKLKNAIEVPRMSFDSALRWFCNENNILLPPGHLIEMPTKEKLL